MDPRDVWCDHGKYLGGQIIMQQVFVLQYGIHSCQSTWIKHVFQGPMQGRDQQLFSLHLSQLGCDLDDRHYHIGAKNAGFGMIRLESNQILGLFFQIAWRQVRHELQAHLSHQFPQCHTGIQKTSTAHWFEKWTSCPQPYLAKSSFLEQDTSDSSILNVH